MRSRNFIKNQYPDLKIIETLGGYFFGSPNIQEANVLNSDGSNRHRFGYL